MKDFKQDRVIGLDQSTADRDAVKRFLDGDSNAFASIMQDHGQYVTAVVARHVPMQETPEVVQEVFVRASGSLGGWSQKAPLKSWLAGIAVRTCHDFWRSRYRRPEKPVCEISQDGARWLDNALANDASERYEAFARSQEAKEVLDIALSRLSPEDRMVLTLVHLEERSIAEAAELLGFTQTNTKVRAHRSRQRLRRIIEELQGEES